MLKDELEKPYFLSLKAKILAEYTSSYRVCPTASAVFRAFQLTPFEDVKVIIIGQDPYPNEHADGLAFSSEQRTTPYSLQKVLREVDRDVVHTSSLLEFKTVFPTNSLVKWAEQGVLLINPVLTVRMGVVGSHQSLGWQEFTMEAIRRSYADPRPKVVMAWGGEAHKIADQLTLNSAVDHLILKSGHPASGAHGKDKFSGCNHFSKANHYLYSRNTQTINWELYEKTQKNIR